MLKHLTYILIGILCVQVMENFIFKYPMIGDKIGYERQIASCLY